MKSNLFLDIKGFTVINMDTKEKTTYPDFKTLLDQLTNTTANVYVYELKELAKPLIKNLIEMGYSEMTVSEIKARQEMQRARKIKTLEESGKLDGLSEAERVRRLKNARKVNKLMNKEFMQSGDWASNNTSVITVRKNDRHQIQIINSKDWFGGTEKSDIAKSVGEEDVNLGNALAIKRLVDEGFTKYTMSGNAFSDYKRTTFNEDSYKANKDFRELFPVLKEHNFFMQSFQGGLNLVNEDFIGTTEVRGTSWDANSMFSSKMSSSDLYFPVGEPMYFEGKFKNRGFDPLTGEELKGLYFTKVRIGHIKLKDRHFACVKEQKSTSIQRGLVERSLDDLLELTNLVLEDMEIEKSEENGESIDREHHFKEAFDIELVLSNVDEEILFEHYHVENIEYLYGYSFDAVSGQELFGAYVDKWFNIKQKAKMSGDKLMYKFSKLMLNSLYGYFGSRTDKFVTKYMMDDMGEICRQNTGERTTKDPVYAPIACFVSGYARRELLNVVMANRDAFLYADTDSCHIIGEDIKGIAIDEYALNHWKKESDWDAISIFGKKSYCLRLINSEDKVKVVCGGIEDKAVARSIKEFEDFHIGKAIIEFDRWIDNDGIERTRIGRTRFLNISKKLDNLNIGSSEEIELLIPTQEEENKELELNEGDTVMVELETVDSIMEEALSIEVEEEPVIEETPTERVITDPFDITKIKISDENIKLVEAKKDFLEAIGLLVPYINGLETQLGETELFTFDWNGIIVKPKSDNLSGIIQEHLDEYQRIMDECNFYIDSLLQMGQE